MSAPPPPPPHGEVPRSSGLPPGKYDIFVIPEHSAGAGFLYLPSLKPSVNSFFAGFASALILVALFQSMAPAFRTWWETFQGLGNMGITLLMLGVGFGAWALGRTQKDTPGSNYHYQSSYSSGGSAPGTAPGGFGSSTPGASPNGGAHARGHGGAPPPPPPHGSPPPPPAGGGGGPSPQSRAQSPPPRPEPEKPKTSWQRPPPQPDPPQPSTPQPSTPKPSSPKPSSPKPQTPKGTWEKAREETRKKEEERKAKEAEQKRREEAARRLAELRAKEARERQEREKERERKEKEIKDKKLKEEAEQRRKELVERLKREREEKEKAKEKEKEKELGTEKEEQKKKEASATEGGMRVASTYAFSGVGEKTNMWPNGRPPVPPQTNNPPSPEKKPPAPTARTYVSTPEDDAYSYRPYDQPNRKNRRPSLSSFAGSDASWAQSHTTARTSPPPSVRGPYSTKDPDKIVIQAVYLFMSQYSKTPASQLVSGVGSVTDGLILRITTEGLFIDDDVRGVPQREWDVKAWTLKLVEVWCPPHCLKLSASATSNTTSGPKSAPHLLYKMATARRNADRDSQKVLNGDEADAYLTEMLRACKDCCRLGLCERTFKNTNIPSSTGQTGVWKSKGLHVLRASVRDQEGKRYVFVMNETESWKLAFGLQRLRGGTQVRHLGVAGMTPSEARGTLEMLGWSG
ncbi:hypothetical protein J3459_007341 [Metarhizium acridum]|uniref:Proline-rich protein RiP-15 n=1 Tax=Metarhizium acridum (strain CQMa 102) TaxID=655827 RepID=E9EG96_METAQ|nr:uncharacterized protein MAC_08894 [Metarhizium acridum CQMa 102]EFY85048.1 hypothetical protein MAC_08894 [Metarhizium acridum CQMa 102]KAG8416329.1 hypothetical protein J3458_006922 [Metarhizium acridum]KAG8427308.1 hypothetical protein J3459_007341 [Metarhizium acridum]